MSVSTSLGQIADLVSVAVQANATPPAPPWTVYGARPLNEGGLDQAAQEFTRRRR